MSNKRIRKKSKRLIVGKSKTALKESKERVIRHLVFTATCKNKKEARAYIKAGLEKMEEK